VNLRPDATLTAAFSGLAADPRGEEWEAAILVNRVIDPGVHSVSIAPLLEEGPGVRDEASWQLLERLGFRGDEDALRNLDNSCVSRVIERRRGLPITLALVLIEVARARGEDAWGLNTPGHFLARVNGQVIDPVRMLPLPVTGELPRAGAVDVALRMLNNIKHACLEQRHPHSALVVIEHQRGIAETLDSRELQAGLCLEAGSCWYALHMPELAREQFEACIALSEEGSEVRRNVEMRLRLLGRTKPPTLH
jgi:hypothetical protein